MRIATLFVRHGTDTYADALERLDALFARQLPGVEHEVIVIDNRLPADHEAPLGPGRVLLGASNAHWEFSAWDRGVAWLGRRLDCYDFIHLATSAFHTLYTRYLERFTPALLALLGGRAAAVGHIDCYNKPVRVLGRQSQCWLRTSFVFLPPLELRLLGSFVSVSDPHPFFSGCVDQPFRPEAPLCATYRQYIRDWLTGAGTGQGTQWHSQFVLSAETLRRFESKAMAILNEQLLSIRLRAQGCALVDVTWLATRYGGSPAPVGGLGAIPAWRHQVSGRDTDALVL